MVRIRIDRGTANKWPQRAVIAVVGVLTAVAGFGTYEQQQSNIAHSRASECDSLVSKYEADSETKTREASGGNLMKGVIFGTPKSHFSKKLNRCLGSFSSNYSYSTHKGGVIIFDSYINNIVESKELLKSTVEERTSGGVSTSTILAGVSKESFYAQEASLMSN